LYHSRGAVQLENLAPAFCGEYVVKVVFVEEPKQHLPAFNGYRYIPLFIAFAHDLNKQVFQQHILPFKGQSLSILIPVSIIKVISAYRRCS
jgi:hypothetical protein